jgi:hypothetical protein
MVHEGQVIVLDKRYHHTPRRYGKGVEMLIERTRMNTHAQERVWRCIDSAAALGNAMGDISWGRGWTFQRTDAGFPLRVSSLKILQLIKRYFVIHPTLFEISVVGGRLSGWRWGVAVVVVQEEVSVIARLHWRLVVKVFGKVHPR